jgi:SAM-dependent methyltransferase
LGEREPTAVYDELWQTTWGDMQSVGPVHRHLQDDVLKVVSSIDVASILDVGCGSGENLAGLARARRYSLAGTDISSRGLELARRRVGSGVPLHELDIEHARLAETFDLVMSVQVVEHLIDDVTAIRNIAAMTRRYVYTSTISGRMRRSERGIGHIRNYSALELTRKHELAGLEVLWVRGWGFPFYSPLYRTLAEFIPSGPPTGQVSGFGRVVANGLYQLYKLNVQGRGDVISLLARVPASNG